MESLLEFSKFFSSWVDQAKENLSYPASPPKTLVAEFENAMGSINPAEASPVISTTPSDVVSQSSLFTKADTTTDLIRPEQIHTDQLHSSQLYTDQISADQVQKTQDQERNLLRSVQKTQLSDQERINLEKGLQSISDHSDDELKKKLADSLTQETQKILNILAKRSENISPLDLLQVQRYAGMLSFSAESGKKTSESIGEAAETILDMEG